MAGIITQGARDFGHIQYVAAYKVAYSNDSMNWVEYKDPGSVDSKVSVWPARVLPSLRGCPWSLARSSEGRGGAGWGGPGPGALLTTPICLQIFPGNLDNNSHKKNMFEMPFLARFVRILPVAWHNRITMRVELLGC